MNTLQTRDYEWKKNSNPKKQHQTVLESMNVANGVYFAGNFYFSLKQFN